MGESGWIQQNTYLLKLLSFEESKMKWYLGIPLAVAIAIITILISGTIGFNLVAIMVIATGIWAAIDSNNIELRKYKSGISYRPVVIFFLFILLWIAAFPWYLHIRYKIKNGLAELKEVSAGMEA